MIFLAIIFVIAAACIGAFISRMCGGGKPDLKYGLDQFIYAVPFFLINLPAGVFLALVSYGFAVLGKRTGHGQYLSVGGPRQPPLLDEKLDGIVRFFMGPDRGYSVKRDVVGMVVTGLALTLVPGLIHCFTESVVNGLLIILSGAAKGGVYYLGRYLHNNVSREIEINVVGEYGIGAIQYGLLAVLAVA